VARRGRRTGAAAVERGVTPPGFGQGRRRTSWSRTTCRIHRAPAAMGGRAASESPARPNDPPAETGAARASAPSAAQAGARGSAGMPITSPGPMEMPADAKRSLVCGPKSCEAEREQCCVAMLRPLGVPVEADLSCQPRGAAAPVMAGVAGAPAPATCALSLQCTSDADCSGETVCCMSSQLASCKPQAACDAELGRRLVCRQPSECPVGQKCCLHMDSAAGTFAHSACEATCDLANAGVRLCAGDADCQDDPTAGTCTPSSLLPAVRTCWPAL